MAGVMSVRGYDSSLTQHDRHDPGECAVCGRQLHGDENRPTEEGPETCSEVCWQRWEIEHWDGEYVGQLELLTERWADYRVSVHVEGELLPVAGTVADVDRVQRVCLVQEGDPFASKAGKEREIPFDAIERIEVRREHAFR
jgi:hypothetical protein